MEHFFTTYVRTKTLFQHRFNDLKDYSNVRVYTYELKKLGVNNGPLLYSLKERGEIDYDEKSKTMVVKALRDGPIDPALLERTKRRTKFTVPLTRLHFYMRDQLMHVDLDVPVDRMPMYFKTFLELRHKQLGAFFTVDSFAGRVHTPVVNLKGDLRVSLKFYGGPVVSLDVKQMQPTILAKVLQQSVGDNPFSTAIFDGKDVYVLLQENAGLSTRAEAKKLLFQLIFGKPMNDIGKMFKGDTKWVEWINSYKSKEEPLNPHKNDKHTNLAWLLQFSEVKVMTDIWNSLMRQRIPFLTIHDDVLCRKNDQEAVYRTMERELRGHFSNFKITVNHAVN